MENKFYPDNFEQLLRDTTDNFRMYPSRRVWHSIYNDLHPSRKWPSLAVCLLLISSIVYVGLSNRNEVTVIKNAGNKATYLANTQINTTTAPGIKPATGTKTSVSSHKRNILTDVKALSPNITDHFRKPSDNNDMTPADQSTLTAYIHNELPAEKFVAGLDPADPRFGQTATITDEMNQNSVDAMNSKKSGSKKSRTKPTIDNPDKEWIEDYAFHNKPFISKWKSRVTYQLYATPSIGYRSLSKNTSYNTVVTSSLVSTPAPGNTTDYENALSHVPAVNMELGGNILYSVSKKINLKLGVQFNYSNYNINAYDFKHPTMTTVMLNDLNTGYPLLVSRPTTLANTEGVYNTKLNSNTYQVSLPIGADFRLAGKSDLKWYAGATIQPTYIAGGNAYLISSDLKNYVDGNSLMRTWNLNAGVETFISYKTKSGIILNAGPQFRYQVFSTLTSEYTYDEKLYNLGLKIGVVTKF